MIIRTWSGGASTSQPGCLRRALQSECDPELRSIDGFVGATLLREAQPDQVEFFVLTKWASLEAIRAFAGKISTRAVVEPEAVAALLDFDKTVRHYEVWRKSRHKLRAVGFEVINWASLN